MASNQLLYALVFGLLCVGAVKLLNSDHVKDLGQSPPVAESTVAPAPVVAEAAEESDGFDVSPVDTPLRIVAQDTRKDLPAEEGTVLVKKQPEIDPSNPPVRVPSEDE
jgi:hypothetical protein